MQFGDKTFIHKYTIIELFYLSYFLFKYLTAFNKSSFFLNVMS